jgi:hypothetical protein
MSKFTETLIASVLAVAVAGPAAADVDFADTFVSNKPLKVKITGGNCKTTKFDFATSTLGLGEEIDFDEGLLRSVFPGSGYYELSGFTWAVGPVDMVGNYVTRKIDKDLTASIWEGNLGGCVTDEAGIDIPGLQCEGIAEVIQTALIKEGCGAMTLVQSNTLEITKGQIKLSKKGDRAKVDFKVEGTYANTKKSSIQEKKVKFTIKGKNYDKVLANN